MFALLSSHCPLIPYAAGSAPRTTQFAPDLAHPVSGTDPLRTARSALASTWFAFGRMVCAIRCTPAAKQNVVPAGLALMIDWASSLGLITTPLHGPATAGPASSESTVGTVGTGGVGVVVVPGFVGLRPGRARLRRRTGRPGRPSVACSPVRRASWGRGARGGRGRPPSRRSVTWPRLSRCSRWR